MKLWDLFSVLPETRITITINEESVEYGLWQVSSTERPESYFANCLVIQKNDEVKFVLVPVARYLEFRSCYRHARPSARLFAFEINRMLWDRLNLHP